MGSLYLCANPSPWSGIARIFDFGNTFDAYNYATTGKEADNIELLWDWAMTGGDLWNAVYAYKADVKCSTREIAPELVER